MLEYTDKYWRMLIPLAKRSLVKRYGRTYTKELVSKADVVYRDLLDAADDIGKNNPMASNLYEALIFVSLWRASDGTIDEQDLRGIVSDVISAPMMKIMGLYINMNKPTGIKRMKHMFEKNVRWLESHPECKEYSWDFNFDDEKNGEGFYYYFTRCPINSLARRENFLEILPVLCDIDFATASLMHAKLYRQQTLAQGEKMCDYWYIGDKKQI